MSVLAAIGEPLDGTASVRVKLREEEPKYAGRQVTHGCEHFTSVALLEFASMLPTLYKAL